MVLYALLYKFIARVGGVAFGFEKFIEHHAAAVEFVVVNGTSGVL